MRITRTIIRNRVSDLVANGCDLSVNGNANGVRFMNNEGSIELSHRFAKPCDAWLWLDGFTKGLGHTRRPPH